MPYSPLLPPAGLTALTNGADQLAPHGAGSAFAMVIDALDPTLIHLFVSVPGSRAAPSILWTRRFEDSGERDALLEQVGEGTPDPVFLGRLALMFGAEAVDVEMDGVVATHRAARAQEQAAATESARRYLIVHLYAREGSYGRQTLSLQRASRGEPDWTVSYDRAIERDRLCDWLKWQGETYLDYLTYASTNGGEALTRLLTDLMFATERRVKQEGRGAGGMRPLRMWRGD